MTLGLYKCSSFFTFILSPIFTDSMTHTQPRDSRHRRREKYVHNVWYTVGYLCSVLEFIIQDLIHNVRNGINYLCWYNIPKKNRICNFIFWVYSNFFFSGFSISIQYCLDLKLGSDWGLRHQLMVRHILGLVQKVRTHTIPPDDSLIPLLIKYIL